MAAKNDLKQFISNLKSVVNQAQSDTQLRSIGNYAVSLIVKRTRLGYGVDKQGNKSSLKRLSPGYIKFRKTQTKLSSTTSATKSNLTFTGQMLESMQVIKVQNGTVIIGPTGYRSTKGKSLSNAQVANYVAKAGRPFNNLSTAEQSQLVRYYRRLFGDLVDRKF